MTDAHRWGVQTEYHDATGALVPAPGDSIAAALRALGAEDGPGPPPPGALIVHRGDELSRDLEVVTEDGRSMHLRGRVPDDMPLGYHAAAEAPGGRLVVSPGRCHLPSSLRLGGWAVQLYAARSRSSWGIGDLADLRTFGTWARSHGAGFTLLSPLNAVALSPPVEASPYLPTSRRWRNPLYLRVEDVPGCDVLGAELESIARAGRALNAGRLVDRDRVAALKLDALARVDTALGRSRRFEAWRRAQGDDLELFATFSAIAEEHGGDFRAWPPELREPHGDAVGSFRRQRRGRVRFHAWLQWLMDAQLGAAADALPVMVDLPVGVAPGGADVWADRDLFATAFSVGAPPDLFNTLGQDWSQPPWNPWQLRARGYAPLVAVLRAAFGHAMGVRVDHVMGLFRLFWVPPGGTPADGLFVRYPAEDMLDILALESVRASAVVVGEDLGTVEPGVRESMAARDMLSYRLVWFEDEPPGLFPERALCAVSTHDLPTLAGMWTGSDSEDLRSIGVPVSDDAVAGVRARLERVAGPPGAPLPDVTAAVYEALAGSPSMLVATALDDAAGVTDRPNVPGTTGDRRPNWRIALPRPIEQVVDSPLAVRLAGLLRRGPRVSPPAGATPVRGPR